VHEAGGQGVEAATHWSYGAELAHLFPKVRVESDPIFVRDWAPSGAFGRGSANHHYDGAQRRVIGTVTRPYVGAMTTVANCGPAWRGQLSRR